MNSISADTLLQLFTGLAILAGMIVVGVAVVQRFRGGAAGGTHPTSEMLSKFHEMHREGDISEKEYRTIKSVLGDKLQRDGKREQRKP
ncbi:MAG: hypothetical protein SFU86_04205 [Pirellulaceae bacterium]|nr:hypothetical protein [Pirellulaceae bacterium]